MKGFSKKPMIRYRFKDSMGCVTFRAFRSEAEALIWYEKNKMVYSLKEFGSLGYTYKSRILDTQ